MLACHPHSACPAAAAKGQPELKAPAVGGPLVPSPTSPCALGTDALSTGLCLEAKKENELYLRWLDT